MKVYIVTSGEYSAYTVHCVCSTRAKAEELAKAYILPEDMYPDSIIEMELDVVSLPPPNMQWWQVAIRRDGTIVFVNDCEPIRSLTEVDEFATYCRDKTVHRIVNTWAKDEQHAVKIANERRAQLIANNQWPEQLP